jgi:CHAT domain-containing protein
VAFVVTSNRLVTVDLPVTGVQLSAGVDFLRGLLTGGESESAARGVSQALGKLGTQLIAPIEATGVLAGKRRLLLVPHRELHYLPFAALVDAASGRHLIERYELSSAASAAIWLRLAAASPSAATGLLALAPLGRELPGADAEVTAIARMYGSTATVLKGARATRAAFTADAPRYEIIHLATLGVLNRHNPLFSFVTLAPSPGSDGRLEVHDLAALKLNARLVVLSACQTALGAGRLRDVPLGDDWVGLVGAFHAAGASRVLATLWPVHDRVTALLMTRFYTELRAGRPESTALAIAQRSVLADPRTRSPFYWAGFVLDGSH